MANPASPEVIKGIQLLMGAVNKSNVSPTVIALSHLRASQINGCSFCVESGSLHAKRSGETEERLFAVAAWRESPRFTNAERAALALTEAVTRIADEPDPVPDEIWNEAAKYFDEQGLATLVLSISMTNVFNRFNAATRQIAAGEWK
jgi:AhpD family alkylhydroperoxidase